ncbi:hypothetical protein [Hoeflea olei]|uniref:Uncharacterized protein n=1 Tax=Hoeflea olei TaxID=1480615 RepID=A0A1C1YQE5_9HYPH|nr:hypothetical protein [Hoeflea olei]OCW55597.1 hypothetical protein AWJ14_06315 [Hoeflea olei]
MRKYLCATLLSLAVVSPALAGNATLKKDGKSYALNCSSGGCFLSEKISMFKSGPKQRLGPGGVDNFKAWQKKLKSQGYN